MVFRLLGVEEVIAVHDAVLNPGELDGLAKNASLDGALSRIEFRMHYGMIQGVYDLAAMYAVVIAQAHSFRDANKRTALTAMEFVLQSHGITITFETKEIGDFIIEVAQGNKDETELAEYLRAKREEKTV